MKVINLYQQGDHNVVFVGRDSKGNRISSSISHHRPYMYIPGTSGTYRGLFGEKLKKLVFDKPMDVTRERDNYPKTWESDIIYTTRVLIDEVDKIEKCPIRKLYFDIELQKAPDDLDKEIANPNVPVVCISAFDSFSGKEITTVWHPTFDFNKLNIERLYAYKTEEGMLQNFILFIKSVDPDILTGWNTNKFDIMYLYNRCKKLSINFGEISKTGRMKYRDFHSYYGNMTETEWTIAGRYAFDLLRAYRFNSDGELDSYKLNDIAKNELKDTKLELDGGFEELWNNDIKKLIEYNRKDVMLCKLLDDKTELIDRYDERRIEIGCQWSDLWQTTKFQDVAFLRACKGQVCLPRRPKYGTKAKPIKGGYVMESQPGLHTGVIVLDLESLYPSIILSFNMSPETISPDGNIDTGLLKKDKVKLRVRFRDDVVGWVPKVIMKYRQLRKVYKKIMHKTTDKRKYNLYDKRQHNAKIMGNSAFGYIDNPTSRWLRFY